MIALGAGELLLGAVARTPRGRSRLTAEGLQQWAGRWAPRGAGAAEWWTDEEAGVALLRPQVRVESAQGGGPAVLSIRGLMRDGGRGPSPTDGPALSTPDGLALEILRGLLERDVLALKDLRGQWVLAHWDGRRRRLLIARDHLGQRVIFTRTGPDLFLFCSELAPLLGATGGAADLDAEAAYWYLSFGMPPPRRTLARGVERLPAAHLITWSPGGAPLEQRFWSPLRPDSPPTASPETVDEIQHALDRSIVGHCSDGTPQGVFLSGGTDSTYLITTAASQGDVALTAFTSAFEDEFGMNDDARYAAEVAEGLGISHRVVPLHAERALEILEEVVLTADEPCAAWASMTHFELLVSARRLGVGRMLSGLGADEIFGGYEDFHRYYARFLEFCGQHPAPGGGDEFESLLLQDDSVTRHVLYPGIARFFGDQALGEALSEPYRSWQHTPHLLAFYRECRRIKPGAHPMEMMVAHECQHRIPDLLFANFEALSRRVGVEVCYPWMDPDVVELAAGLDALSRYRTPAGGWSPRVEDLQPGFKHALMLAYERKVPEKVLTRPIKTFTAPFGAWFTKPQFAAPLLARLRASRFWERGILQPNWLARLLNQQSAGTPDRAGTFQLWAILTLTAWYDRFVDPPA